MSALHRLRTDLVIIAQRYQGEESFIVKDVEARKYYRFRPVEIAVMQEFDGTASPEALAARLGSSGLTISAAAIEGFARKLKQMGLLERSLSERSVLQLERLRADRRRRLGAGAYRGSLLRMRWSVGDPDALFDRWLPRLRFFFTPTFLGISVLLFLAYAAVAVAKWPELSREIVGLYTLSGYSLGRFLLLWVTVMGIIAVHELGHGLTCKYFGGQVHEMGAMLIYFEPAFYCNVNDAWTFTDWRHRLWVTLAGPWIQLVLAGIAALVWWLARPETLVSEIALFAVLAGGITTIVANANPLIPLDGYYALSDYLEIPNLRQRALGYCVWRLKRQLLRLEVPEPAGSPRERRVFLIYGGLSAVYSALLLAAAVLFMGGWLGRRLGAIGLIGFTALVFSWIWRPLTDGSRAILTSLREHRDYWRRRSVKVRSVAVAVVILLIGFLVPWPLTVRAPFVVRAPTLLIVAAESAMVEQVYPREGERVAQGALLVRLRNLVLEREAALLGREADSLDALATTSRIHGRAGQARQLEEERQQRTALLQGLGARLASLEVRAPRAGVVVTPRPEELTGRWMPKGGLILRLLGEGPPEARVSMTGPGAGSVLAGLPVRLLFFADPSRPLVTQVNAIAAAGDGSAGALEARIALGRDSPWRPGMTGEARIVLARSSLFGALWWNVRTQLRGDLLL